MGEIIHPGAFSGAADVDPWSVVVGNIGEVYGGAEEKIARGVYAEYVKMSTDGYGRAAGEPVVLFEKGEPEEEFDGRPAE